MEALQKSAGSVPDVVASALSFARTSLRIGGLNFAFAFTGNLSLTLGSAVLADYLLLLYAALRRPGSGGGGGGGVVPAAAAPLGAVKERR